MMQAPVRVLRRVVHGGAGLRPRKMSIMAGYKKPSLAEAAKSARSGGADAQDEVATRVAKARVSGALPGSASGTGAGSAVAVLEAGVEPDADGGEEAISSASRAVTEKVLSELQDRGEIHAETLRAVEETEEWKNYEAHVQFEMSMMRMRYSTTQDEPMTPQRRSQMQAHLRQVQQKVMEEHADTAAKKFVEGVSPEEVRLLRRMLTRIDAPAASGPAGGRLDIGDVKTVDGQQLKQALWELSSELGKAAPELRRTLMNLAGPEPKARKGGPSPVAEEEEEGSAVEGQGRSSSAGGSAGAGTLQGRGEENDVAPSSRGRGRGLRLDAPELEEELEGLRRRPGGHRGQDAGPGRDLRDNAADGDEEGRTSGAGQEGRSRGGARSAGRGRAR